MQSFHILENDAGQRLDKFLKKLLPNASLSLIYKLNRKNRIKVGNARVQNEYRLLKDDEVRIFLRDDEFEMLRAQDAARPKHESAQGILKKDIVYEDGSILIINKDPGVIVHPGDYKTKELSLIQLVHDYLGKRHDSLTFKPSLVHRIDKDTSGIVIIAKTKKALDSLLSQLQKGAIRKTYLAITASPPPHPEGTISSKILRLEGAEKENKVRIDEVRGQRAVTHYRLIPTGSDNGLSVVECILETGRMHQIRVHLASIGCPIIGDKSYGSKEANIDASRRYGVRRQLLHAYGVRFVHPENGKTIELNAKLKEDMIPFVDEESLESDRKILSQ